MITTSAEPVQVAVGPSHRGLDHLVHLRQRQVASELEPPPDRRVRPAQVETHLKAADIRDRAGIGRRGHVDEVKHQGPRPPKLYP